MQRDGNDYINSMKEIGSLQFGCHISSHNSTNFFLSSIFELVENLPKITSFAIKEKRSGTFQRKLTPKKLFYRIVFPKMIIGTRQVYIAHGANTLFPLGQ
jgi:hypothetical protein